MPHDPIYEGKPIEKFPETPPMPSEIKREANAKREELETLQEADANAPKTGSSLRREPRSIRDAPLPTGETTETGKPDTSKPRIPDKADRYQTACCSVHSGPQTDG
jgi:hypothetical protein